MKLIPIFRCRKKKHRHVETDGGETTDAEQKFVSKMYGIDPADEKNFDKTPHDIFVQLSELNEDHTFWEEKSRWIKYEECKEEGKFTNYLFGVNNISYNWKLICKQTKHILIFY